MVMPVWSLSWPSSGVSPRSLADSNCLKLPGSEGGELEDDFVLLADIFPTA
jgi:hypothetical protein